MLAIKNLLAKVDNNEILRGIDLTVNMIVNGFCKEVFRELPMEFAVEARKLLGVSLEGSVG
jgi:Fe-S cluster assembly protein SufB